MLTDATMLEFATVVARGFEFAGIAAIVVGSLVALGRASTTLMRRDEGRADVVPTFRKTLGQSILTGLELLVAADIIRTVAVAPSIENVTSSIPEFTSRRTCSSVNARPFVLV